ncbi:hypothetical protein [Parasphingorhabdus cellanae]|uniref:Transaldolase n=1 Tax=Parasphingorhabdus cellanae TaxID=2806553 RepID=A0ABX7T9F1_9SPHN|nr:hypothetical protein [Parasphingorhabdus cellanae]QTD56970.1 hypothetical protein J4G78_05220 [Parasphingorhabdus cellanae]
MINTVQKNDMLSDASYLAHRYDEVNDAFRFLSIPREVHRRCTFITDEHLPNVDKFKAIARSELVDASLVTAPVHFIFHSAYCCSTMLARAFDIEGVSMGLKEPVVLNDMIGWRRRGADPAQQQKVIDQSLSLLARPFGADQAVIIKPSNICNPLAIDMLRMRPDAKALLLYAPIEGFLKSIAKKEMWGRIWVRDVLIGTLKDGYAIGGFSQDELLQLTDLQVAAIGWLSQHALFAKIIAEVGKDRVKTLDSETFLARSPETIAALSTLYGLKMNDRQISDVVQGPAFTSHSKLDQGKPGEVFDAKARGKEQQKIAEVHGTEIDMVATWAKAVADSQGIKLDIGSTLL